VGLAAGVATGLVLLAVGLGLGPRHLAKEGLSMVAVLGLLLLAVGLVLTVRFAWQLLAAVRRRWWAVVVPILLVATYLALWTLGQAVAASWAPRPELGARTPADVGLAYVAVSFPSSDGVRLSGWYVASRNGAAVALMHGAGSARSAVLDHAEVLAEHGYGVLVFDARGHGRSDGRAMDFGWYGEADAAGALDFLAQQREVSRDRLGLVGLSMGGEQAVGAAGVDDRVAAVVAEGVTSRVAADKGYLAAHGTRGEVQQRIDRATYWLVGVLSGDAPEPMSLRESVAVAGARPSPTAFLLIAAGDEPDEALAADFIRDGAAEAVETWVVPSSGHVQGLRTDPGEWEERVVGFLDSALAAPQE
jgi:pimeloyl-ACP methyl ester carboxylesterase